jgi:hypothetical protein
MKRDTRNSMLKALLGVGMYLLDPLRDRLADRIDDISDRAKDIYETGTDRVSDLSDRLRGNRSSGWDNAVWMLVGVGVGVGVGMLLAPASGEETRRDLADKVQEVGDKVRTRFQSSNEPRPASGTYGE